MNTDHYLLFTKIEEPNARFNYVSSLYFDVPHFDDLVYKIKSYNYILPTANILKRTISSILKHKSYQNYLHIYIQIHEMFKDIVYSGAIQDFMIHNTDYRIFSHNGEYMCFSHYEAPDGYVEEPKVIYHNENFIPYDLYKAGQNHE